MKRILLTSFIIFCLIKSGFAIQLSTTLKVIGDKTYFIHQVEKGQTFYSICKLYSVEIQEIVRQSEKPALQDGELLTIPAKDKVLAQLFKDKELNKKIVYLSEDENSESIESSKNIEQFKQPEQFKQSEQLNQIEKPEKLVNVDTMPHPQVINIALLLPLNLGNIDKIENNNSATTHRYFAYASALEAALLAVKNYENSPDVPKVSLYIYDISDEISAKKLILNGKLQKDKINVMIGPIFLKSFVLLADYAKKNNILIINPLSDKDVFLMQNNFTVKVNTSDEDILKQIIQDAILNNNSNNMKDLIIIYDSLSEHISQRDFVKKILVEHKCFANIKEVNIYNGNIQNLNKVLSEKNNNILLYLSDNEAFVSQIISNTSKQKADKKLYCTRFFEVFNQQELKYLEAIDLHYAVPFNKNKDDETVRNFERKFYEKFRTLPDANAFLFYDLTNMIIESVYLAPNEQLSLENSKYEGLGYSFDFLRSNLSGENGLQNIQIRIVNSMSN
jgi:ABC-type branched-subunit amino acid transport system substrate-binding protein